MEIKDKYSGEGMQGYLVITRTYKDGTKETVLKKNLVVTKAREIVRNLVYGDGVTINGLSLGDANVPPANALQLSKIPQPSVVDINLTNRTYEARITGKQKVTFDDRPAIKYSFYIDYEEGNGTSADNFFCEAGLTLPDGTLFTRLTFRALTKDSTSALNIDYYLLF